MATEHRPAPLPPRPGQPSPAGPVAARKPPPAGAAAWSRTYVDAAGLPQAADHLVPVDADGRRTAHVRHTCRGKLDDADGRHPCDQIEWLAPGEPAPFCRLHGCQLEPDGGARSKPLLPWPAMWASQRMAARAWWVVAAELAAGIGEYAGHAPWWSPVVVAPLLVVGAYEGTRRFLTRRAVNAGRVEKGQRAGRRVDTIRRRARLAAYGATAGGVWLAAVPPWVDPHSVAGGLAWASLLPVWAVTAGPWWARQRAFKDRPGPPAPAVAQRKEPTTDEIAATEAAEMWDSHVAIAGTKLDPATWKRIPCGWQAVIVATRRGAFLSLGGDNWKATERKLGHAFDVPPGAVTWIENHEASPNKALLLIQPNNPLKRSKVWGGPDTIRFTRRRVEADAGTLIDGQPMVETLFRFGWGAPSELVLGTTGGGKSARARKRLVMERWATFADPATGERRGLFLSFLHDPKRLESYAEFRNAIHGYGMTRDDAHIMIDAFLREMFRRYDMLALNEWVDKKGRLRAGGLPYNPLIHGPIISVYWDEFHELTGDKEFVAKLEKLARFQRACGMRATLLSHMGTLGDTGSQALRDMLAGGRATLFRTTSGLNAALATGGTLTGDPRTLPKDPGMCYVADGETATLMGRETYVPNDEDAEEMGERSTYDWLFDDDNNPIGFPAEIPAETAEAFGREFMQWMEAGRRPGGRVERPGGPSAGGQDSRSALDALRQIVTEAGGPVARKQIAAHQRWTFNVTSTLTKALSDAKAAGWLVGSGEFVLSEAAAEQLQLELTETAGVQ